MSEKTLFLAWHDKREESRLWFPIGRLDADVERSLYRFRYTGGAKRAEKEAGFPLLVEFPELEEDYQSSELFPLFRNRVIAPGRPDRAAYLRNLDLPENANPFEILSVNGGTRVTDAYEVFRNSRSTRTEVSIAVSFCTAGGTSILRDGIGLAASSRTKNCISHWS